MRGNIFQQQSKSYDRVLATEQHILGKKKSSCMLPGKLIVPICVIGSILSLSFACIISQSCPHLSLLIEGTKETRPSNIRGTSTRPSSNDQLLKEYQICRPSNWESYVCKGPTYDDFADKLEALLLDQEQARRQLSSPPRIALERKPPLWGKRQDSPFPANTTILALGNSHTRQVLQALFFIESPHESHGFYIS